MGREVTFIKHKSSSPTYLSNIIAISSLARYHLYIHYRTTVVVHTYDGEDTTEIAGPPSFSVQFDIYLKVYCEPPSSTPPPYFMLNWRHRRNVTFNVSGYFLRDQIHQHSTSIDLRLALQLFIITLDHHSIPISPK